AAAPRPIVQAQVATPSGGISHELRFMMGTSMEVRAFNGDEDTRIAAIDEAFDAIAEVDRLMSNYRPDSELAYLDAHAGAEAVTVSAPLFSVIDAAQQVSDRSGGAFDITIGPAVRLWGFHDKKPHVPDAVELQAIRPLVGYRNLLLDNKARTVRFARPGLDLDLGGIAKGFAAELAANVLKRHGLGGFIDCGGNQYMLGLPPGKASWTVGVRDPERADGLLGTIDSPGGSVSTSAGYANFLVANGRRYGHIIDPRTLTPAEGTLSVTVLAPDGTLADAVSTAAFVLGPDHGLALIDSFPGMTGLIVYRGTDGKPAMVMSRALEAHFHRIAS
ncbi:MAG: FAD:protein FMN transferase, partial [Bacteroidales bacterium]